MADKSKKSSSAKRNTKKVSSSKRVQHKNEKDNLDYILDEILYIVLILFFAVLFVGNFLPEMVVFGPLASFLRGLFGIGSYFLSVLGIWYLSWEIKSKNKKLRKVKLIGIVILFFAVSIFTHLLGGKDSSEFAKGFALFEGLFKEGAASNGGALGGVIACKMNDGLTFGIAVLVTLIILIISLILFTGKSFFNAMAVFGRFLFKTDSVEDNNKKRKTASKKALENDRQLRLEDMKGYGGKNNSAKNSNAYYDRDDYNQPQKKKKPGRFNFIIGKGVPDSDKEAEKAAKYFEEKEKVISDKKDEPIKNTIGKNEKVPFVFDLNKSAIVDEDEENKKAEYEIKNPDSSEDLEKETFENPLTDDENRGNIFDEAEIKKNFSEDVHYEEVFAKEDLVKEQEPSLYEEGEEPLIDAPLESSEEAKSAGVIASADSKPLFKEEDNEDNYVFPPIDLLDINTEIKNSAPKEEMLATAKKLEETLSSFGVVAKVIQINRGPTVTRYELSPGVGVKVSKIAGLSDDIALNLAAAGIRIEAPIPGKAAVGIEVPNKKSSQVLLRDVIDTDDFKSASSRISFALGQDIAGNTIIPDIAKMPHMLIAGATGSGKSVCINTIITSIIYKANPKDVKLILVDPKVVELSVYNGIPHLMLPVVTDPKKAAGALNWGVREMLMRYQLFAEKGVRDIFGYNNFLDEHPELNEKKMPQIVIIVDELADLMMAAPGEVEDAICRLAQMARAAGMHLIIATQRPSVDVITGVIKANIPSRIAFSVSSGVDSRTIIDMVGAEKLLGKGDMLFYPMGLNKPLRVQGAFVSDKEVENIVKFVKGTLGGDFQYDKAVVEEINSSGKASAFQNGSDLDEFYDDAVELVVEKGKASASMLQRQFRIGYNRASRLIEDLENNGIVGPEDGSKPRKVLLTKEDYYNSKLNEDI